MNSANIDPKLVHEILNVTKMLQRKDLSQKNKTLESKEKKGLEEDLSVALNNIN